MTGPSNPDAFYREAQAAERREQPPQRFGTSTRKDLTVEAGSIRIERGCSRFGTRRARVSRAAELLKECAG